VVDILRTEGVRVGVMGLRLFRPFPDAAIREALAGRKSVIVFEKALSYGNQGALYADIKSALYCGKKRPPVHNYILGLGGREIKTAQLVDVLRKSCAQPDAVGDEPQWIGLKL
jgi:pyruvate ferredoxin oxidoreductase alpha subunit